MWFWWSKDGVVGGVFGGCGSAVVVFVSIVMKAVVKIVFGSGTAVLGPFKALFVGLLLAVVMPLVFLALDASVNGVGSPGELNGVLVAVVKVFILASLVDILVNVTSAGVALIGGGSDVGVGSSFSCSVASGSSGLSVLAEAIGTVSASSFMGVVSGSGVVTLVIVSVLANLTVRFTGSGNGGTLSMLSDFGSMLRVLVGVVVCCTPVKVNTCFTSFMNSFNTNITADCLGVLVVCAMSYTVICFIVCDLCTFVSNNGGKLGLC